MKCTCNRVKLSYLESLSKQMILFKLKGPITIPRRRGEVILIINMRDLFQDILTWLSQRYNFR